MLGFERYSDCVEICCADWGEGAERWKPHREKLGGHASGRERTQDCRDLQRGVRLEREAHDAYVTLSVLDASDMTDFQPSH